ncbi:hypothetical protein D9M68_770460 [compost metagenome]
MVSERATKATLDPAQKSHAKFKARAKDNGLLLYPMRRPRMACGAMEADISRIVERLVQTMNEVLPR